MSTPAGNAGAGQRSATSYSSATRTAMACLARVVDPQDWDGSSSHRAGETLRPMRAMIIGYGVGTAPRAVDHVLNQLIIGAGAHEGQLDDPDGRGQGDQQRGSESRPYRVISARVPAPTVWWPQRDPRRGRVRVAHTARGIPRGQDG
jgi:hypothetical protein